MVFDFFESPAQHVVLIPISKWLCCLAEARKSEDREELGILRVSVAIHQQLSGNLVEEEIEEGDTRAKTGRKGSVLNPECIWELPGEL